MGYGYYEFYLWDFEDKSNKSFTLWGLIKRGRDSRSSNLVFLLKLSRSLGLWIVNIPFFLTIIFSYSLVGIPNMLHVAMLKEHKRRKTANIGDPYLLMKTHYQHNKDRIL